MNRIWYDKPADAWNKALPIGNGRLGAMVFGGIHEEKLELNQDSIYSGGFLDRVNPEAKAHLEEVRELILSGQISKAEEILKECFSGIPRRPRTYQTLCRVDVTYYLNGQPMLEQAEEYCRELKLGTGLVEESYSYNGTIIKKEYFASYPHGVIVTKISAEGEKLSLNITVNCPHINHHVMKLDSCTLGVDGASEDDEIHWRAGIWAKVASGSVDVEEDCLKIKDADTIYLYVGCETSFYEKDYQETLQRKLTTAVSAAYEEIRECHIGDYQKLYQRVDLILEDGADTEDLPMDQYLLKAKEVGYESSFAALYFQYGRYLLIASSRPGSLPANLQGIWNDSMRPGWGSRYTININTQMNYWPAEMCSLPECHLPFFDLLDRMWELGKDVAEKMYGCRGFVAHHNTDLWGDCAPNGTWMPGTYWVMGGAWMCTHVWQHYLYTQDKEFLKKMYPIIRDAVLFFHDFLIEEDGQLLICPSVSPENTYILPDGTKGCIGAGTTMDTTILRDLIDTYVRASEVLGVQEELIDKTKEIADGLPKLEIGKYGQLMEWRKDYEEASPGHRHISHLYGLHPSHQITVDKTPELAKAAEKTLERRLTYGGGQTGWSCAWIINFFARLGKSEDALNNLHKLWNQSTFPNLMDTHPVGEDGLVFQIDGNFGATAAIAEMFVQSDEDRVLILPALPMSWGNGKLIGVTVAGGAKIDLSWKDGKLSACYFSSTRDMELVVVYGEHKKCLQLKAGMKQAYYGMD